MLPPGAEPSEKSFAAQVLAVARLRGWSAWHDAATNAPRRCPHGTIMRGPRNAPGFPDLVLVRDRVLYRELKVRKGRLKPEQREWRDRLLAAGADWAEWRPSMWDAILGELE